MAKSGSSKKKGLLSAVSIFALGGQAAAVTMHGVNPAELIAYEAAIASRSPVDLQRFLANYPESKFSGSVFAALVQRGPPPTLREYSGRGEILFAQYGDEDGDKNSDSSESSAGTMKRWPQVVPPAPIAIDPAIAQSTLDAITIASGRLQSDISRCEPNLPFEEVANCLGLALSYYATSLSSPNIELPEQLKQVAKIVVRTAKSVRNARSAQSALGSVEQGVSDIRKQITLLQVADDSATAKLVVRAGDLIAASLDSVANKLRQVEL